MEPIIHLLYTIFVCCSGISLLFLPFGFYALRKCLQTIHFNLKILIYSLGFIWLLLSIGCSSFYFILGSPENPPQLYQIPEYQYPKLLAATSAYSFRLLETSIVLERVLATIYFRNYETRSIFKIYPFCAILFSLFLAFCFAFLFNVLRVSIIAVYAFLVTIESTNFILLRLLQKKNRILRIISSNSTRTLLTSKYQITENIRTLNLLFPQATISFIISNITIISTFIITNFHEPSRVPLFLALYCLNVTVISIYWMYQLERSTMTFSRFIKFITRQSPEIVPINSTFVQATLGQTIQMNQTVDEHFNSLKNTWR